MSMGSSCLCNNPSTVGESLASRNSVYVLWSPRPENLEMRAILINFGAAWVLAATGLSLGTDTVLAFGGVERSIGRSLPHDRLG